MYEISSTPSYHLELSSYVYTRCLYEDEDEDEDELSVSIIVIVEVFPSNQES